MVPDESPIRFEAGSPSGVRGGESLANEESAIYAG